MTHTTDWYRLTNELQVASPALLIYPDRVEHNIRQMIAMAGGTDRLRPHVKTHKMPRLVEMQMRLGITRFKTATIAEAEMTAAAGALDVLLAYQPVGPNVHRLVELIRRFPSTKFMTIADDPCVVAALSEAATNAGVTVEVMLDLNVGMDRTGILPGDAAAVLYRKITTSPGLKAAGLHAYDGHLRESDPAALQSAIDSAFAAVWALRDRLKQEGLRLPRVVACGTPTFAEVAGREDVEVSAGTTVLWDFGQEAICPSMNFLPAALLLTRVVSRPTDDRLCLDLGHKAVASEMPHPRVRLIDLPDAVPLMHSEEHLVIQTPRAADFPVGTALYAIPRHVCPSVALHEEAVVVRDGRAVESWTVTARRRRITI